MSIQNQCKILKLKNQRPESISRVVSAEETLSNQNFVG